MLVTLWTRGCEAQAKRIDARSVTCAGTLWMSWIGRGGGRLRSTCSRNSAPTRDRRLGAGLSDGLPRSAGRHESMLLYAVCSRRGSHKPRSGGLVCRRKQNGRVWVVGEVYCRSTWLHRCVSRKLGR